MRTNVKIQHPHGRTHEGAPAAPATAEQALRRSVMSCFLWENEFYEDGEEIGARIARLARSVSPRRLADIAIEAREVGKLRHAPLLLLSVLASIGRGRTDGRSRVKEGIVASTIPRVIQRADELTEFLAVHARLAGVAPDKIKPIISAQMKKGLALAFRNFDEYQFAKYFGALAEKGQAIKARDVLRLCHAKPKNRAQAMLWKRAMKYELEQPDTWEVALSAGEDKAQTFSRLIVDGKLGYLALLRNLRNMIEAGVDESIVRCAIAARRGARRVLPFRYVAAARAAPQFEKEIDEALKDAIAEARPLPGKTVLLVDVSGSMGQPLSAKSDLRRIDAAAALASIVRGDDVRVVVFDSRVEELAHRLGMAGVDNIRSQFGSGATYLGAAVRHVNTMRKVDRLIVITDEQSHDAVPSAEAPRAYMINVASAQRGVGYGPWVRVHGFSENVLRFIHAYETDVGLKFAGERDAETEEAAAD